MARHSQNGYTSYDRSVITRYTVSDSGRVMNLRVGSPGQLLAHFIRWFDRNIRDIDPGILDDWSYAERPIRGSTDPNEDSNHASGTAGDVDATKWPLGVQPERYLTAAEIARVREQLKLYEGCIRWGGDYTGRKDPMHFEIDRDEATCDRVWVKIQEMESDDMPSVDEVWGKKISHGVKDFPDTGGAAPAELMLGEMFANARNTLGEARQIRAQVTELKVSIVAESVKEAARDAAVLAAVKATGAVDPELVVTAVREATNRALAEADFPTATEIAEAVLSEQERAELDALRERVRDLTEQQAASA